MRVCNTFNSHQIILIFDNHINLPNAKLIDSSTIHDHRWCWEDDATPELEDGSGARPVAALRSPVEMGADGCLPDIIQHIANFNLSGIICRKRGARN